jgi:glycosyltransferase involved in cell wall biosynthesis
LISVLVTIAWVILVIQFCYWVAWWIAFNRSKSVPASAWPPLSVIVCAHDEEQNLRALIPLLLAQTYPEFELIIVEDRCNDGTYDYLLQATKDYPRLRMVRVQHLPPHVNGKKFALTLGIRAASHDWIVFTDADCRPANDQWLRTMAAVCIGKYDPIMGCSSDAQREGEFFSIYMRRQVLHPHHPKPGIVLGGLQQVVIGTVIAAVFHDNQLEFRIRLCQQQGNECPQILLLIMCTDNHRQGRPC